MTAAVSLILSQLQRNFFLHSSERSGNQTAGFFGFSANTLQIYNNFFEPQTVSMVTRQTLKSFSCTQRRPLQSPGTGAAGTELCYVSCLFSCVLVNCSFKAAHTALTVALLQLKLQDAEEDRGRLAEFSLSVCGRFHGCRMGDAGWTLSGQTNEELRALTGRECPGHRGRLVHQSAANNRVHTLFSTNCSKQRTFCMWNVEDLLAVSCLLSSGPHEQTQPVGQKQTSDPQKLPAKTRHNHL